MNRNPYVLAVVSGLFLALSFPRYGHPAFGWIALAPLLVALRRGSLARAFGLGLTTGAVYFTGTVYWITRVMIVYGGLSIWTAVLVNAALVLYLALFPALFAVVVGRGVLACGPPALMASPLVWVATELGRTYLFGGFPWVLLGYSQATVLPIAQLASVFGVYGVSALVASVSAGLAIVAVSSSAAIGNERHGSHSSGWGTYGPVALSIGLALVVAGWGARRAAKAEWTRAGDPVRVGLVQGNVDQGDKGLLSRGPSIFADYIRLTRQAIAQGADIVLWPESSTPFRVEDDRAEADELRAVAAQAHVPVLVGSDQVEPGTPVKYYNAAFLIEADGSIGGVYRKMHLVPFGEYVPLKNVFFFAGRLVEAVSDFSPGTSAVLLPVDGHVISTAICYEIVYPNLVRQFVAGGSELLTTITNDAWFGDSSAPYQHFEQASMRAIEEGRYLVRSANTGISGIVDPYGRVLARSSLFQPAVIVGDARFLRTATFYARYGDGFAYASAVATLVLLLQSRSWRLWMT
jgi:apolipoprotein N-acyltransferase